MAFKNILLISALLVMVVLIPSMVAGRDLPETSSNPKAVEDIKKASDQIKISGEIPVVVDGVYVLHEANTSEESKISNPGANGMSGAGHHIQCRRLCCNTPWGCVCC